VRRALIHLGAPSFSVGAMCVIERDDGDLLLVRQSYRDGWGVPGGLLRRREEPADGARREAEEEVGVVVEPQGEPVVVIDARVRRIDVVFRCRIRPPVPDVVAPASVEIAEVRWFPRDALPPMQRETAEALRRVL
jgi:8-oxo-dGTP pyrophosphatase MutT (NUDIX family)